ncbi:hypothetical protein HCJ39_06985 [Listeria rocourtiae]|uniref:hypothetical protein n=1 Tax=Listeria rocourtiae TaxID=647910 RepID=UPI001626892D|nr:hypothetical protein [Listeria rocourtiae]MBC1604454.1 hypothetical protein [Listeria rocourtiae]
MLARDRLQLSDQVIQQRKITKRFQNIEETLNYRRQGIYSSQECLAFMEEQIDALKRECSPTMRKLTEEARQSLAKQRRFLAKT